MSWKDTTRKEKKPVEEPKEPVRVVFKTNFINAIYDVLSSRKGWVETESDEDWDFTWADVQWILHELPKYQLRETQRINHYPNFYELTRKDFMAKNLKKIRRTLEREGKTVEAARYGFFPISHVLPQDYQLQVEEYKKNPPGTVWIMKPVGKSQGKGIFLWTKLSQIAQWKRDASWKNDSYAKDPNQVENYICQKYIHNPYLVGGKKFDMRIYVLVTTYTPLTVYLYRSAFARFSNFRYSTDSDTLQNNYIHLTNVAIQKTSDHYEKTTGCKWHLKNLKFFLTSRHGRAAVDTMFEGIRDLIVLSLKCVEKTIISDRHSFELYGYDVMIDQDLKPWLLEVNASPSLSFDTDADYSLKFQMLNDMLDIVDMEKKLKGDELEVGDFDLIYRNGIISKPTSSIPCFLGCSHDIPLRPMPKRTRPQPAASSSPPPPL